MFVVEIGQPAKMPIPDHDGVRYAYRNDGHTLVLFFSNPKPHEVRAVQSGPVRFALTPLRETPRLLFLLYTFQGRSPGPMRRITLVWSRPTGGQTSEHSPATLSG